MTQADNQTNSVRVPQKTVSTKRTRAQVLRDKVVIRLATDETGPLIAEVLKSNGIELPGADWSKVFPNWLIATVEDEVIGCLQVLPAKPVSHCEFLAVRPNIDFKTKAIAIRKLMLQGIATAYHGGASYVACNIDAKNKKFEKVVKNIGSVRVSERALYAKRVK